MNYKVYHEIKRLFNAEKTVSEFYQQDFSDKDFDDIGEAAALAYAEDKISSTKLEAYSELLSYMNLDKFTFAVSRLYEIYHNSDIILPLTSTSKRMLTKSISIAVYEVIMKRSDIRIDEKKKLYEQYNANIVDYLSGYKRIMINENIHNRKQNTYYIHRQLSALFFIETELINKGDFKSHV